MTYGLNQYCLYNIYYFQYLIMRSKNTYNNVLFQNEFGLSEDQVAGKVVCIFIMNNNTKIMLPTH